MFHYSDSNTEKIDHLRSKIAEAQDEKLRERLEQELNDVLVEQTIRRWAHANLNPPS